MIGEPRPHTLIQMNPEVRVWKVNTNASSSAVNSKKLKVTYDMLLQKHQKMAEKASARSGPPARLGPPQKSGFSPRWPRPLEPPFPPPPYHLSIAQWQPCYIPPPGYPAPYYIAPFVPPRFYNMQGQMGTPSSNVFSRLSIAPRGCPEEHSEAIC
ncbi:hypothetical protein GUJ93_ZPchr0013g34625 [Zizania palustris]|uniref:Uncharacterized protein n=1 Tax=Zizania palustris TaxID=103762 RepID=A0A8J6BX96_ZIZPA|nr:hypothetical protein GUJ93_ZPchr0013g34625 [Zizania palustris]